MSELVYRHPFLLPPNVHKRLKEIDAYNTRCAPGAETYTEKKFLQAAILANETHAELRVSIEDAQYLFNLSRKEAE